MLNLGQITGSRFDTAFTDENHAGATALVVEAASQDKQVTVLIPSMRVSKISASLAFLLPIAPNRLRHPLVRALRDHEHLRQDSVEKVAKANETKFDRSRKNRNRPLARRG